MFTIVNLAGEHHDHQRQGHPAEAELAGVGPRDELDLPRFSGQLSAVGTSTEVRDSRWK